MVYELRDTLFRKGFRRREGRQTLSGRDDVCGCGAQKARGETWRPYPFG
jgi:hypothetical protein